ncbi:hypothetical protein [Streptomyces sp. NPDC050538]
MAHGCRVTVAGLGVDLSWPGGLPAVELMGVRQQADVRLVHHAPL